MASIIKIQTLYELVDLRDSETGKSIVGDIISEEQFERMQKKHAPWANENPLKNSFWPHK